eukprot:SAG31_NODE_49508_length_137_cov_23.473684_1_plen_30_part_01
MPLWHKALVFPPWVRLALDGAVRRCRVCDA